MVIIWGLGQEFDWAGRTGATLVNGAGRSLLKLLWAICNSPRLHRYWTMTTTLLLAWCLCNSPAKLCYPLDAHGSRNGAGQILRQRLAVPANYADWAQSMWSGTSVCIHALYRQWFNSRRSETSTETTWSASPYWSFNIS